MPMLQVFIVCAETERAAIVTRLRHALRDDPTTEIANQGKTCKMPLGYIVLMCHEALPPACEHLLASDPEVYLYAIDDVDTSEQGSDTRPSGREPVTSVW
jgi:hypothetical protein